MSANTTLAALSATPGLALAFGPEVLDPEHVVHRQHEPFPFLVAHHVLSDTLRAPLAEDFPNYRRAGFFPMDERDCGPAVRAVVQGLESAAFADRLGELLGVENMGSLPTIVTLRKWSKETDGRIHNDSRSKVATALLYLNETWPDTGGGCFRVLTDNESFEHLAAPEVRPLYGQLAAFRRTENSWHGHPPYTGERRVIQVAWLTGMEEKRRKEKRGRFTRLVKVLFTRR